MSMIENFEKLQNTSCAESIFDDINKSDVKKCRTEIRQKESDLEMDDNEPNGPNVSTKKDSMDVSKNTRAEILVNMRFR